VRLPLVRARSLDERAPVPALPGTALPLGYRKARKHLGAQLCAVRIDHDPSCGEQVPAGLVPAVHAVALEPARARFSVSCFIVRDPTPATRAILDAFLPPHDWAAMTPCGRLAGGAPARYLPEIGSSGVPAAVSTPALVAPVAASVAAPVGALSRLPRPSIREILMNELRAPELWTDLPAELRNRVALLMRKLL
jgi:hypothetical protein